MENKKPVFGNAAAKVGKNAAGLFDKAKKAVVDVVDQNSDGKLGLDDFSIIKDSVKSAVKESSDNWNAKQEQLKREKEYKELRPFFQEDVDAPGFSLPKLLRIAPMDAKHAVSAICENSIGYYFSDKEMNVMTIYPEMIDQFDLKIYPDMDSVMYYVDPNDRDFYIALDEYFNYLKIARVGELQKIAQDLGATHFRVTFKEQKKSFSKNDVKGNAALKLPGKQAGAVSFEHHAGEETFSRAEIAAEMVFIGHEPVEPTLNYFRKDPQIQNLIALRMSDNTMKHQIYTLNLSNSSGIKVKDAVKIDAALKAMKIEGNASVASEAENETLRLFEYEIDF